MKTSIHTLEKAAQTLLKGRIDLERELNRHYEKIAKLTGQNIQFCELPDVETFLDDCSKLSKGGTIEVWITEPSYLDPAWNDYFSFPITKKGRSKYSILDQFPVRWLTQDYTAEVLQAKKKWDAYQDKKRLEETSQELLINEQKKELWLSLDKGQRNLLAKFYNIWEWV